jgi:CheY-like chemotaxis protein
MVRGGNLPILLVEDESLILMVAQAALEDAEFDIVAANDGPSALAVLRDGGDEISGLIADYNLGSSVTGREVIEAIRRHHPKAPIILASAFPDAVSNEWHWQHDVELLIKPYRPAQLVQTVRSLFQRGAISRDEEAQRMT